MQYLIDVVSCIVPGITLDLDDTLAKLLPVIDTEGLYDKEASNTFLDFDPVPYAAGYGEDSGDGPCRALGAVCGVTDEPCCHDQPDDGSGKVWYAVCEAGKCKTIASPPDIASKIGASCTAENSYKL